jgi:hypothetical protein
LAKGDLHPLGLAGLGRAGEDLPPELVGTVEIDKTDIAVDKYPATNLQQAAEGVTERESSDPMKNEEATVTLGTILEEVLAPRPSAAMHGQEELPTNEGLQPAYDEPSRESEQDNCEAAYEEAMREEDKSISGENGDGDYDEASAMGKGIDEARERGGSAYRSDANNRPMYCGIGGGAHDHKG